MKKTFSSLHDLAAAFDNTSDQKNVSNPHRSEDDTLVYSTDKGRISAKKTNQPITNFDGFAKVRRETKGRKGKGVIAISGLGLSTENLKKLASKLKKTCGSGGSVVGEVIEIQGDKRELIKQVLEKEGFKVKFIGG